MKLFLMATLAASMVLFVGCAGTPGPIGVTGSTGPTGNANVKQYTFGARAASSAINFMVPTFTQAQFDSSTLLSYVVYSGSTTKYPAPGVTYPPDCVSTAIYSTDGTVLFATLQQLKSTDLNVFCTTPKAITSFVVIVIPASSNVTLAKAGGLNLNDYNAVRKFYNLPE